MAECYTSRQLAQFGANFTDTLTAVDSVELVPAIAGHKYRIIAALIQRDDVTGSDIVLTSGGSNILICSPADGVGELEGMLIDGGDLTVDVSGTGTAFYNVDIIHL